MGVDTVASPWMQVQGQSIHRLPRLRNGIKRVADGRRVSDNVNVHKLIECINRLLFMVPDARRSFLNMVDNMKDYIK